MLRADVPTLGDEQFALTLAEVARSSTAVPVRRRVPLGVKVGAIAASVALTTFGVAYASDLLTPSPPTNSDPSSPGTDEPTDREREIPGPVKSDEPADTDTPSVTESTRPDDSPTETNSESAPEEGDVGSTAPMHTEVGQESGEPEPEEPPTQDEPDSGDDEPDSGDDEPDGEPDSGDDSGPSDGPSDDSDDDSGPSDDSDDDSGSVDDSGDVGDESGPNDGPDSD